MTVVTVHVRIPENSGNEAICCSSKSPFGATQCQRYRMKCLRNNHDHVQSWRPQKASSRWRDSGEHGRGQASDQDCPAAASATSRQRERCHDEGKEIVDGGMQRGVAVATVNLPQQSD